MLIGGPNRCALCGGRIGRNDDRVMLGSHSTYAHMRCVIRYSFSVMRQDTGGARPRGDKNISQPPDYGVV